MSRTQKIVATIVLAVIALAVIFAVLTFPSSSGSNVSPTEPQGSGAITFDKEVVT